MKMIKTPWPIAASFILGASISHPALSETKPAAALYFPGSNPMAAASILGQPAPGCGDDLDHLITFKMNLFSLDLPGPFTDGQTTHLMTDRVAIFNPGYQGEYWGNTWYFIDYAPGTDDVYASPQFNEVLGYYQADNMIKYFENDLLVDNLRTVYLQYAWDDTTGGPNTSFFISIPGSVQGACGTVNWLSDGDVVPHEIGGHYITGLYSTSTQNRLGEPFGDYWSLAMTWNPQFNPQLKIGDWVDEMFGNDGVYLRDLNQTELSFPYAMLGAESDRANHRNGQILTAALWSMRTSLSDLFGATDGQRLADYLVYKTSMQAASFITSNEYVETPALYTFVRDELVRQLGIMQGSPDNGSYRDLAKSAEASIIMQAFADQNIAHKFPNDPLLSSQIPLFNRGGTVENQFHPDISGNSYLTSSPGVDIKTSRAWELQTGRVDVKVAVLDGDAMVSHPDLYANIAINAAELTEAQRLQADLNGDGIITFTELNTNNPLAIYDENANGYIDGSDLYIHASDNQDNDGNGKIDDITGWSIEYNTGNPLDYLRSFFVHGTPSMGIIGAMSNNGTGIAGVNWDIQLLPVQVTSFSYNKPWNIAESYQYTLDQNADVIHAPWAIEVWGKTDNEVLMSIMNVESAGIPYIAAIGNTGSTNPDNDAFPYYPQTYPLQHIITVTAIDADGQQEQRYGKYTADLAAPTDSVGPVYTGYLQPDYGTLGMTSGASPHVTGAIALLLAEQKERIEANPGYRKMTLGELRYLLLTSVDRLASLQDITVSGGTLNAYKLLQAYTDSDMDGYADVIESLFNTAPADSGSMPDPLGDADGDGLANFDELGYGTIPVPVDSSMNLDGIIYPVYLDSNGFLSSTPTEGGNPPSAADTDGDGVGDQLEVWLSGDPANPFWVNSNGNPDMESGSSTPDDWWHANDTTTIWASDEAHSGMRSLKIQNPNGVGLNWQSTGVRFSGPEKTLTVSGWSKAENVNTGSNGAYRLKVTVLLEDGFVNLTPEALSFNPGTHDWEKAVYTVTFDSPIRFVYTQPEMIGGSTGTAWFDDIGFSVMP